MDRANQNSFSGVTIQTDGETIDFKILLSSTNTLGIQNTFRGTWDNYNGQSLNRAANRWWYRSGTFTQGHAV